MRRCRSQLEQELRFMTLSLSMGIPTQTDTHSHTHAPLPDLVKLSNAYLDFLTQIEPHK